MINYIKYLGRNYLLKRSSLIIQSVRLAVKYYKWELQFYIPLSYKEYKIRQIWISAAKKRRIRHKSTLRSSIKTTFKPTNIQGITK